MNKRFFKIKVACRKLFRPKKIKLNGKTVVVDRRKFSSIIVGRLIRERYERSEIRLVERALGAYDRVLEAGAGMGLVSMVAADIVGDHNILCFEADLQMVEIARRNFSLNAHDIEIRHGLLQPGKVSPDETKKFNIHSNFWSSSSRCDQGTLRTVEVPVSSLCELIKTFCPTVLLVDIEGDEVELLAGVNDFGSVRKIILEIHYQKVGHRAVSHMMDHLYSRGFHIDQDLSESDQVVLSRI